jgi:hypothetical protein
MIRPMSDHPILRTPPADDWLDAALRAEGREHRAGYLADDGFTARVMAKLPAPLAASPPAWRKRAVIGLWTAAGVGAVIAFPGAYADFAREYFRVVAGHPVSLAQIIATVVALGVGSWTAMVWAVRRG